MAIFIDYPSLVHLVTENVLIDGIMRETYSNDLQITHGYPTGFFSPEFAAAFGSAPMYDLTTQALNTVLANLLPANGYALCPAGEVRVGYVRAACPTRNAVGALANSRTKMLKSFVELVSITATLNEPATADVRIHAIFDETNAPVTWETGIALPAFPAGFFDEIFTVGPCSINGVVVQAVQSISITINTEIEQQRQRGDIWNSWVAVRQHAPRISIECFDFPKTTSYSVGGSVLTDAKIYLRRAENLHATGFGGRFLDAALKHLRFNIDNGIVWTSQLSVGGTNDPVLTRIDIAPVSSDTTWPVEYALNSAITLP